MAERRMRLKRGKDGDTGVQVTPPFPESLTTGERSPWDERVVEEIVAMVSDEQWNEVGLESLRRAIRITMATQSMTQVLQRPATVVPPPPPPPPARTIGVRAIGAEMPFASVHAIDVAISHNFVSHHSVDGTADRRVMTSTEVTVTVQGAGDPVTLLRQAADRFHSDITNVRVTSNSRG
jgi:hypothetical protein